MPAHFTPLFHGQRFGRLTVIDPLRFRPNRWKHREIWVLVQCDCGTEFEVRKYNLERSNTASCGCLLRDHLAQRKTHGASRTRLYRIWTCMKTRCFNPNGIRFARYGGRGVQMDTVWVASFAAFRAWAMAHGYRDDLSIDRIDVDGDYEPGNCRFIPLPEQQWNTTRSAHLTAFGDTKVLAEWARDPRCVVSRQTLAQRLASGWPPEDALMLPTYPRSRHARLLGRQAYISE